MITENYTGAIAEARLNLSMTIKRLEDYRNNLKYFTEHTPHDFHRENPNRIMMRHKLQCVDELCRIEKKIQALKEEYVLIN